MQPVVMGTARILIAANSPGTLHRLEETLSGLEVHVAIRLRDVAKEVKRGEFALLVFCLGFDEQSEVEILRALHDEHGMIRLPVVCVACDETRKQSRETEARLRDAGACDVFELRHYPSTPEGNAGLRARILACAATDRAKLGLPAPARLTPMSRTLYRAALFLGGVPALAKRLDVPEKALRSWIQGEADPPAEAFLAALELVLLEVERGPGGREP